MMPHSSAADAAIAEASLIVCDDAAHEHDPVVGPIYQTSLFTFKNYESMREAFAGESNGYIYSRVGNPTAHDFERRIAALEGAEAARGFASGMAAISATVLSVVQVGRAHRCGAPLLWRRLPFLRKASAALRNHGRLRRWQRCRGRRGGTAGRQAALSRKPQLDGIRTAGHRATGKGRQGAWASSRMIDNSWATPVFQKPIAHGVDLVVHSASKYIGGHSDTVAGVVAGSAALIARINELTHPFLRRQALAARSLPADRGLAHPAVANQPPHGQCASHRRPVAPAPSCHQGPSSGLFEPSRPRHARRLHRPVHFRSR